jgi:hypothetical protein
MTTVFQSGGDFDSSGVSDGRCILPDSVPNGKRLVIETVTGFYYGDGARLGAAYLTVGGFRFAFPWTQCTSPGPTVTDRIFYGFNNYVRIYVDGPAQLQFDADGGSSFGGSTYFSGSYALSGILVDP